MNYKQQQFVNEYLIDLNATQAAIRAGYSAKTAGSKGEQLLKIVAIKAAVGAALDERRKKNEVTADYVISSLKEVAERCLQRAKAVNAKGEQIRDEEGRGIWQFDSAGANKALGLLGKYLGLFTDKVQVNMTLSPKNILAEVNKHRKSIVNENE